jgi:hypothetical protein
MTPPGVLGSGPAARGMIGTDGAVVATDRASVDADYDNGASFRG